MVGGGRWGKKVITSPGSPIIRPVNFGAVRHPQRSYALPHEAKQHPPAPPEVLLATDRSLFQRVVRGRIVLRDNRFADCVPICVRCANQSGEWSSARWVRIAYAPPGSGAFACRSARRSLCSAKCCWNLSFRRLSSSFRTHLSWR